MGTSASNGGPKGSPPLLPDWYNDDPPAAPPEPEKNPKPDEENQDDNDSQKGDGQSDDNVIPDTIPNEDIIPIHSKDWGKAKGALTRLSNNTSGASTRKAASNYVRSLGGSKGASRAAAQGVRTGGIYAGFLGTVASSGMNGALISLGLQEFIGKSFEEICIAIANAIAPVGTTNDEAIARDALITTLDSLYSKIEDDGSNVETLDTLSLEQIKETLVEYVSNFVFTKWMYELGIAIEKGTMTENEAIDLETEVKDLIYVETIERYRDVPLENFNLNDHSNKSIIEDIFQTAYSTLES